MYYMEWLQPANVGKAGWAKAMRLNGLIGITAGLALVAQQSSCKFGMIKLYGGVFRFGMLILWGIRSVLWFQGE